ncbi:hypothetical protein BN136_2528 [Cronobacter universalis NCTC 9529]|nr:hypothetical protein BN136_2528 [Cronobacter universalis NCTC 9529]
MGVFFAFFHPASFFNTGVRQTNFIKLLRTVGYTGNMSLQESL